MIGRDCETVATLCHYNFCSPVGCARTFDRRCLPQLQEFVGCEQPRLGIRNQHSLYDGDAVRHFDGMGRSDLAIEVKALRRSTYGECYFVNQSG